ncbi:hypothetical protein WI697_08690 [Tistrella mobilis]|uniref:hypothetical protein n=1 Tax=Tistrella mobilis TaxID=171437 RepID=UPI0031F70FAE
MVEIDHALGLALGWLNDAVAADGCWPSQRVPGSPDDPVGPAIDERTPFVTAVGLLALEGLADSEQTEIAALIDRSRGFLVRTMRAPGVWAYLEGFVPDCDDTACASMALSGAHPWIASGRNRALGFAARVPDGRFRTWMAGPRADLDIDAVVNANMIGWLGDAVECRAAADFVIAACSGSAREALVFYDHPIDLAQAVARAVRRGTDSLRPALRDVSRMAAQVLEDDGAPPLRLAQALDVADALDMLPLAVRDRAIALLVREVVTHGYCRSDTIYLGVTPPAPPGCHYRSDALATALTLGALARARRRGGGI